MTPLRALALLAGLVVLVGTTSSVLRNLVVPRRLRSKLTRMVSRVVAAPFRAVAYRSSVYENRDRLLAWAAPITLLAILVTWLLLYMLGYGLLIYASSDLSWSVALREAGSSVFTLGFASTDRGRLTAIDFAAAMTGPIVIGLQVGYLPALYGAYNRREAEVTMLDSRAGEPNWGPEILARHAAVGSLDNLSELYRGWERWAADVSESHSNYPVLIFFRSQQASRNWLIGLLSVMDSAALTLAFNPASRQGEPRMALRMGFVCLRDLAETIGLPFDDDPDPDDPIALTFDEFMGGVERLQQAGYPMERTPEEAWPHFRGWRINYESIAYPLAAAIDAVPAPWSGPRKGAPAPIMPRTPVNRQPGGVTGPPGSFQATRPATAEPTEPADGADG